MLSAYEIIDKKKNKGKLTSEEISWFINGYLKKEVHDYQVTALLMAIFLNGMDVQETAALTDVMLYSGKTLKFEGKEFVDKHSTGGIGDKASFILAPIAAAAGVKVPMIAGRGLGFTGGTVDKIEAVAGFNTAIDLDEYKKILNQNGLVLIGQTPDIAPADKLIYALRDVTATIDSIPLITASIMSKKLAEGANGFAFDIKTGTGAFMKKKTEAKKLAQSLINTGARFNKKSVAVISDMNQPLGHMVGHSLEIIESIETLKGKGPKDLTFLSVTLAAHMIHIAGIKKTYKESYDLAMAQIKNGKALEKFRLMLKSQGGDEKVVDHYSLLPQSEKTTEVKSPKNGYIKMFQNDLVGLLCTELGGGRKVKSDKIDFAVGFNIHKKIGDKLSKGDVLLTIHHHPHQQDKVNEISKIWLDQVVTFSSSKVSASKTVFETIQQKPLKGKKK